MARSVSRGHRARHSLSRRVFWTIFLMALGVIAFFAIAGTVYLRGRLAESKRVELREECTVVVAALNDAADDTELLSRLSLNGTRITLIEADGTVVYDSMEDASELGNHASRPEVAQALEEGHGSSERASSTLGEVMLYEAALLEDGSVVRLAQEQAGLFSIFSTLIGPVAALAVVAAVVALMAARSESRAIIAPLTLVDLDHPRRSADNAYVEMEPMLDRIEKQRQELKRQMRVLADNDRMRREFTANVTHELKTPLTAISGYAELIASDMVESKKDVRKFGKRIYREAGRLTSLVNDILTLSNLDEAEHAKEGDHTVDDVLGAPEYVDLVELMDAIYQRLESLAEKNQIELSVHLEPAVVFGVWRLLDEMVYNLASNAIRYNRRHGTVDLICGTTEQGQPYARVADTGIGISPDEQDKIFERFYRVDKSRSKSRGGTGLGLAIVKHAALFHGADLELESEPGRGTVVTVVFPAPAPEFAPEAGEPDAPGCVSSME